MPLGQGYIMPVLRLTGASSSDRNLNPSFSNSRVSVVFPKPQGAEITSPCYCFARRWRGALEISIDSLEFRVSYCGVCLKYQIGIKECIVGNIRFHFIVKIILVKGNPVPPVPVFDLISHGGSYLSEPSRPLDPVEPGIPLCHIRWGSRYLILWSKPRASCPLFSRYPQE